MFVLLAELLQRGEVQTVEGFVTGHQIWPQARARSTRESQRFNTWESILVGGVQSTWAHDAGEAAFTNSGASKVEFRDGLPARVGWVEDIPGEAHQRRIVSLEVAADYRQSAGAPGTVSLDGRPEHAGADELSDGVRMVG